MITPVRSERGEITHFIAVTQDIKRQWKRVEEVARARTVQIEIQRRLLEQREQERLQISRDLHDGPVQDLTAAAFALQEMSMTEPDPGLAVRLDEVRQSLLGADCRITGFCPGAAPASPLKIWIGQGDPLACLHFPGEISRPEDRN